MWRAGDLAKQSYIPRNFSSSKNDKSDSGLAKFNTFDPSKAAGNKNHIRLEVKLCLGAQAYSTN